MAVVVEGAGRCRLLAAQRVPLPLEAVACARPSPPVLVGHCCPQSGTCVRQAEKLPQSSEGAVQREADIHQTLRARPSPGLPCRVCPPHHPSPGQLLVGRGLRTGGGLLDFRVQGEQRGVGHTSAPLVFRSLSLSWGWCSGTPPSSVVPRGMPVVPCGPLGKGVWKSCGVGEPCRGGE